MASPLFVRSVYSLLSSMCSIESIVSKCVEFGYKSCAIVDKNVLSGAMSFKKACQQNSIKPIFGLEFTVLVDERETSMMMLAKDDEGYKNLIGLSSLICTSNTKVISLDTLNNYRKGNILVLFSDTMPLRIAVEKKADLQESLKHQKDLFGQYSIALCDHDIAYNKKLDDSIKELLVKEKIQYFAMNRTYYINKEDYEEYRVLKCIRDKKTISDKDEIDEENRYFLNKDEYGRLYSDDEIRGSDFISSLCNADICFKTSLPSYKCKDGVSSKDYLINLCNAGLKKRLNNKVDQIYQNRLDYELKVIIKMNFEDYFLIVYDFILYAKRNGIMVGPGRGSAAGSLCCYCLGITDVDPIKYGLLFERFLNPERISMPDIDTDFPDDKRQMMFEYIKEKYGIEHVGHIITYGTLKPKQVLRDVARVLELPNSDVDSITKLIPFQYDNKLIEAYNNVPIFKQKIESEAKYRKLFRIASKIEGAPRHESTHAAGVVMSSKPLNEIVPLQAIGDDIYSTQYTMEHLEELGLIKMDFLGLRNLGIIAEICDDINSNEKFDIKKIPLDDAKTFDLIQHVNVLGVFQLESNGMRSLIRKMKPRNFAEIGITIALFRPGPMENIPVFLENRLHPENIRYLVPELEPILSETYGIIVYQEQIMTIARKLASFSYGKADLLRRAMSKKKASELEKLKDDFINGCINNGYSNEVADNLYELILKFANYGFNKSHSVAYGLISYQMAYLKTNYPLYFYKALLNGVIGSSAKTYEYIQECMSINQKVSGISMNNSDVFYSIKNDSIVMPLSVCKDVGSVSCRKIIEERNRNGNFKDYLDCVVRLSNASVEKNAIENLIYAGAFDEFKLTRTTMIKNLENAIKYADNHANGVLDFGYDDRPLVEEYKDDLSIAAEYEKRVLGFYFSYNPIIEIKKLYNINTKPINEIAYTQGINTGFGIIRRVKTHKTKRGEMMAFVDIADDTGNMSLVVMPNLYNSLQTVLKDGLYICFEGNIEKEGSCLVKKARVLGGNDA